MAFNTRGTGEIETNISVRQSDSSSTTKFSIDQTLYATAKKPGYSNYAEIVGGCPCESCQYSQQCKEEELACKNYSQWQQGRRMGSKPSDAIPNRKQYLKILA